MALFCSSYTLLHRSAQFQKLLIPNEWTIMWNCECVEFEKSRLKVYATTAINFAPKTSMNGSFVYVTCWILILFRLFVRLLCRFLQFFLIATTLSWLQQVIVLCALLSHWWWTLFTNFRDVQTIMFIMNISWWSFT